MTTLLTIGAGTYTGTLTLPPTAVPNGLTGFALNVECSEWLDTTSNAVVTFEYSQDGGGTWQEWCSFTFNGGSKKWDGQSLTPLAEAVMVTSAPQGSDLMAQGSAVINGSLITGGITITGQ
jgi:hypothetical protein